MNTCQTCDHWMPSTEARSVGGCVLSLSLSAPQIWGMMHADIHSPNTDQRFMCVLYTKPEFGCNQWKTKE